MSLSPNGSAQTITTLVPFNATWRYNQPTADLGTAWRAPAFNDSTWASGTGLLQGGEGTAYPVAFGTAIQAPNDGTGRVTDYFRTTFNFTGSTNGLLLYATNFVDDGAVIYLNGVEAGRIRVPAGQNYLTAASGGPATEGQVDLLAINPALLRPNQQNYLAVEVHQTGSTSSDVVWGMRLVAYQSSALNITSQPVGGTASVGETFAFSVAVSGGPVFYQWQKDQVNIPGATNSTYTIQPVSFNSAGTYRVIATNAVSRLTSSNAVLTVSADTAGPVMLNAVVGDVGTATNQIDILFDEPVLASSATTNNIRVVRSGTALPNPVYVTVSNILISGRTARLRVGGDNWNVRSNYYILANNVADTRTNLIAVNSITPVSFRVRTNVIQMSAYWDYYTLNVFDPDPEGIYTSNQWYLPSYQPDMSLWGTTYGILFNDLNATATVCAGDSLNVEQNISYQLQPSLFRTKFNFGTNFGTVGPITGTLGLRFMVDDGMILYLNGVEIYRYNVAPGQLTQGTRALSAIDNPTCTTNIEITVTNLMPRTNYLAAAVLQAAGSADTYFGLELDGIFLRPGLTPTNSPGSQLRLTPTLVNGNPKSVRLTWPNTPPNSIYYGYILESTPALGNPGSSTDWSSVSFQSNGVAIPATQPASFFRLRKGPNSPTP
jgi:hypothetical protein